MGHTDSISPGTLFNALLLIMLWLPSVTAIIDFD